MSEVKGSVRSFDDLPSDAALGDQYFCEADEHVYAWLASWHDLGPQSDNPQMPAPPNPAPPPAPTQPIAPEVGGDPTQLPSQQRKLAAAVLLRHRRKQPRDTKPNILVLMGDDIGMGNVSCYTHGIQGFRTANIDRIAAEGAIFTDAYAQQTCTAGRSAFILGQCPFRTGLTYVGMPGSEHGIPDWAPTMGDLLKEQGYRTGQFGKNHLGDWNKHLPTVHGFDEFFGNLYHLNTQEEPEGEFYPKDPQFLASYGPRGVLDCRATDRAPPDIRPDPRFGPQGNQIIRDTGPLTRARMPNFDDGEVAPRAEQFIREAVRAREPFFCWVCPTRCHVWTHLKPQSEGMTGVGLYADAMAEHDRMVGRFLKLLDDLRITDNTIVIWTTDNGAEHASWPDGGNTMFHGEKGTTWEGGVRVPLVIRWPGVIDPGTWDNAIIAFEDFVPTLLAAAGRDNIVEELKAGQTSRRRRDRTWKVHLDGYNFLPWFLGEADKPPREYFFYFGMGGELNAVRWNDWKLSFAHIEGNIFDGVRAVPANPMINNLRSDPYEVMQDESQMYLKFYGDNLWLFIPIGEAIEQFVESLSGWPHQFGSPIGPADLNYATAQLADLAERFEARRLFRNSRD